MIRLGGWCARRPRGAAGPAGRRGAAGGPAGRAGGRALRVLVDMDGVLADFEGGFLSKFRARFPEQPFIALEDRRGFWVSEQYGRLQPGLSEKAISIWESENFFFDLEPLPGAVEAVKQMANLENTDVFICTSPIQMYKYCPYEKYAWVEKHFGPDFLEQIVLTRDKTVVSADLLIDDRPDVTGPALTNSSTHGSPACPARHSWGQPSSPATSLLTFRSFLRFPPLPWSDPVEMPTRSCYPSLKLPSACPRRPLPCEFLWGSLSWWPPLTSLAPVQALPLLPSGSCPHTLLSGALFHASLPPTSMLPLALSFWGSRFDLPSKGTQLSLGPLQSPVLLGASAWCSPTQSLPFMSCVTSGKLPNLSGPQFLCFFICEIG
ncbi:5'(3')-deoxyribonucleotidase, mitochondrial isoform X2 [Diceros bicornis minor]|uniref:5'(3')-deoxyribonucleotidase, mitochondrial isoform X2 n=1 Tax=Diceros bicornis minor TaxID=77932 RepID=UPI0026F12906|nr:5'(3')-deoxyribonucleotidase, mitochondrial isoform X2 [Diceros bicornis minor]